MNKANGELSAQHGKVTDLTGSDSGDERPGSSSSGAARSSSLSKLNAMDVARSFKEYDMALKCNCKRGRKNGMKVVEHLHTCSLYDDDVIQSALYPTIENDNNLKSNPSNEPNGKEHPHESKEYENYFGRYKVDYDIREDLTNQESSQSGRERKKRDEDYTLIDMGKEVGEFEVIDGKIPKLGNAGFVNFKYYNAPPEVTSKTSSEEGLSEKVNDSFASSTSSPQKASNEGMFDENFVVSKKLFREFEKNGYVLIKNCIPQDIIQRFSSLTYTELDNSTLMKQCTASIDHESGKLRRRRPEGSSTTDTTSSSDKNEETDSDSSIGSDSEDKKDTEPSSSKKKKAKKENAKSQSESMEITSSKKDEEENESSVDDASKSVKNTISSYDSNKDESKTSWQVRFPTKLTWTIDIPARMAYDSKGYPGNKECSKLWKNVIESEQLKEIMEHPNLKQLMDSFAKAATLAMKSPYTVEKLDNLAWLRVYGPKAIVRAYADYFFIQSSTGMCDPYPDNSVQSRKKPKSKRSRAASTDDDNDDDDDNSGNSDIHSESSQTVNCYECGLDISSIEEKYMRNGDWYCSECNLRPMVFACWIPLTNKVGCKAGNITVLPGSHKMIGFSTQNLENGDLPVRFQQQAKTMDWHAGAFQPGDVLLMDLNLVRASGRNRKNIMHMCVDSRYILLPPRLQMSKETKELPANFKRTQAAENIIKNVFGDDALSESTPSPKPKKSSKSKQQ